jgi:hypothetical protein
LSFGIEGLQWLQDDRRAGNIPAIYFAPHADNVPLERRECAWIGKIERVPSVADARCLEVCPVAVCQDAPDKALIVGDGEADGLIRMGLILNPSIYSIAGRRYRGCPSTCVSTRGLELACQLIELGGQRSLPGYRGDAEDPMQAAKVEPRIARPLGRGRIFAGSDRGHDLIDRERDAARAYPPSTMAHAKPARQAVTSFSNLQGDFDKCREGLGPLPDESLCVPNELKGPLPTKKSREKFRKCREKSGGRKEIKLAHSRQLS